MQAIRRAFGTNDTSTPRETLPGQPQTAITTIQIFGQWQVEIEQKPGQTSIHLTFNCDQNACSNPESVSDDKLIKTGLMIQRGARAFDITNEEVNRHGGIKAFYKHWSEGSPSLLHLFDCRETKPKICIIGEIHSVSESLLDHTQEPKKTP